MPKIGAFLDLMPEILLIEVAYFSAANEYTFSAHCTYKCKYAYANTCVTYIHTLMMILLVKVMVMVMIMIMGMLKVDS